MVGSDVTAYLSNVSLHHIVFRVSAVTSRKTPHEVVKK